MRYQDAAEHKAGTPLEALREEERRRAPPSAFYAEAVSQVVLDVVRKISGLQARLAQRRYETSNKAPFEISGIIGLTGALQGSIVISLPMDIARRITEGMMGLEGEQIYSQQEIADGVGELTNIVAGNFLALLDRQVAAASQISLPSMVVGSHRVVWNSKDGPCDLMLFEVPGGTFALETNLRNARDLHRKEKARMQRIMVVDDSRVMRRMLINSLAAAGFRDCECSEAANGKEALDLLAALDYQVDAVFCDLSMPVMDGKCFLEALSARGLLDRFPVVVLTADTRTPEIHADVMRHAAGIVPKPFTPDILVKVLSRILPARKNAEA
jgi:CheY-like chemotaxis protein/CheY-specific phosphatase CheX